MDKEVLLDFLYDRSEVGTGSGEPIFEGYRVAMKDIISFINNPQLYQKRKQQPKAERGDRD